MADAGIRQGPTTYANTTDNTFYTSTSVTTAVRNIHVCNTTAIDATISIGLNATAATAANCFVCVMTVPANGTYDWSGFLWLASGDTIHVVLGTASALNVTMSGITS
jgi:hypothetical protein